MRNQFESIKSEKFQKNNTITNGMKLLTGGACTGSVRKATKIAPDTWSGDKCGDR